MSVRSAGGEEGREGEERGKREEDEGKKERKRKGGVGKRKGGVGKRKVLMLYYIYCSEYGSEGEEAVFESPDR